MRTVPQLLMAIRPPHVIYACEALSESIHTYMKICSIVNPPPPLLCTSLSTSGVTAIKKIKKCLTYSGFIHKHIRNIKGHTKLHHASTCRYTQFMSTGLQYSILYSSEDLICNIQVKMLHTTYTSLVSITRGTFAGGKRRCCCC